MLDGQLIFDSKSTARRHVWDALEKNKLAAFPFPPHGRIPNFKGARDAAERLFTIDAFAKAKAIKVNPDSAQRPVRAEALRRGITVYVPTPRLAAGFMKFDPARLEPDQINKAATMSQCKPFAEDVTLSDLPHLDAIVCGSVAVTPSGFRCGKGAGYSDIEFAILAELGHRLVPVATTVHDIQVVDGFPQAANDLPLSFVVTRERVIEIETPRAPPYRIEWERLSDEDFENMPVLAELKELTG